ncbi:MAG TPA: Hsp70 family protein [Mycobacteriales bacterium]|nr:Hsp70 family protein [Mycobacteriales bacterium]
MPVLAIDFGTSTTVAAIRGDTGGPRLVAIDGSPLMPSSVFLTENGTLTVGRDADRQARLDPSRYEPNPKRRIDDGEIMLGNAALPIEEVIAAVLRRVADEVRRQFGGLPADIRLTHPARWGRARRDLLRRAAGSAGLGADPTLIAEPVAAATHYANLSDRALPAGSTVAVYDLGGGTFDVAVLQTTPDRRWNVLAEAGIPDLGGVDFDQALIEHIGRREGQRAPEAWAQLLAAGDAEARRRLRTFRSDVRDAKEALSRNAQAEVPLGPPLRDQTVTRAEFEELIRPQLRRTVELMAEQLRRAGGTLSGSYLVGGSSRIPLVSRLIQEQLRITPSTLDQPETSVATGALIADPAAPRPAAAAAVSRPPAPVPQRPGPVQPPPARPPNPSLPNAAPPAARGGRQRWMLAAVAVLVAAAAVAIVLVTTTGDKHKAAGSPTSTAPPSTAPSTSVPTSSAPNTPSTTPSSASSLSYGPNFDAVLPSDSVRNYLRSRYKLLDSCQGTGQPDGITDCELKNGLVLQIGADVQFGRYYSRPDGRLSDTPSTWKESRWQAGGHDGRLRTWLRGGRSDNPLLYWDRDGSVWGVLGIAKGKVTTTSARALMQTWTDHFRG